MSVSKFLMVNLAVADLCMGVYLFLIVGMDVNTIGVYFNYAIDWQNGKTHLATGAKTLFSARSIRMKRKEGCNFERAYAVCLQKDQRSVSTRSR
jgi:hypothetical protein